MGGAEQVFVYEDSGGPGPVSSVRGLQVFSYPAKGCFHRIP